MSLSYSAVLARNIKISTALASNDHQTTKISVMPDILWFPKSSIQNSCQPHTNNGSPLFACNMHISNKNRTSEYAIYHSHNSIDAGRGGRLILFKDLQTLHVTRVFLLHRRRFIFCSDSIPFFFRYNRQTQATNELIKRTPDNSRSNRMRRIGGQKRPYIVDVVSTNFRIDLPR